MSAHISHVIADGVLQVVIDRPDKKNAITGTMYNALTAALRAADEDQAVRAVLISGTAGTFTAGNDLEDFVLHPPTDASAPAFTFMRALATLEKPLVAAVAGLAIGIGTTLLLHCDLVYATENARFALPFTALGLVPEAGSSLLLPQSIGHRRAAEMLLLGEPFSGQRALDLGLVNQLLPADELLPFALERARRVATLPAGSVIGTKRLMKGLAGVDSASRQRELLACIDAEISLFSQRVTGPATREAVQAFREKRRPDFSGLD